MSVEDIAEKGDTEVARPGSRAGNPALLGRKSVLMGMLTSGFVIANAAQPSAHASGTVKPSTLIATQPPPYVTTWTPSTAYEVGQQVIAPNNDVVSANVAHTSSATYGTDVAKWTPSSTFARKSTETTVVSGRLSDTSLTATYGGVENVQKYGAKGDGTTDDTAAIQSALDYADAHGGGTVFLPRGVYKTTATLTMNKAHLVGEPGALFDRLNPELRMGTVLAPVIATADCVAIKTTTGMRGNRISGITLDMYGMANGSTNNPYTRSQTRGIHIDASWSFTLENIRITHVPSNAAGIFIDDGVPTGLGCFWGRLDDVFVTRVTKRAKNNGAPLESSTMVEAAKDQTARGICLAGNSTGITAITMIDTTTYRGIYLKGVSQLVATNLHSEDAPAHAMEIDGGDHLTFTGGFFERCGTEAPSGNSTVYLLALPSNSPRMVRFQGNSVSGSGWGEPSLYGHGLEIIGDIWGVADYDRYRVMGDLEIDRAGQGKFTANIDVRVLGAYSASTALASDGATWTTVYPSKSPSTDPKTYDLDNLCNTGSGKFTLKGDAAYGAHGKYTITYSLWVRSSSGTFAAGNYVNIALDLEGKWPNGTAATGVAETQRHMLIPGVSSQRLSGVFEFATGVGTTSGYVYLKMTGNRANVIPGLDPTDDGRGTISFRAHA